MDAINVSDLKKLIATAHATLCVVIHALNTKILVGEINRPAEVPYPKVKRKRRTKVEIAMDTPASRIGMDLEKEYQAERHDPLNLPDADKGNTFYSKPKKERKRREKKGAEVE